MASDNKLAYVELCPSSVVTHCVSCRLTAAAESCLVIARSTAVEVYTLSVTAVSSAAGGAAGKGRSAPLEGVCGAQLELLTRSELFGVVESLRAVRLPGAAHETLLLAFAEAKLALLEYDPATRALRTRAAHSFDALALSGIRRHPPSNPPSPPSTPSEYVGRVVLSQPVVSAVVIGFVALLASNRFGFAASAFRCRCAPN